MANLNDVNPLELIGAAPASAATRADAQAKVSAQLPSALAQILQTGSEQRKNTAMTEAGQNFRTGLEKNIVMPQSGVPTAQNTLDFNQLRSLANAATEASTRNADSGTHLNMAQFGRRNVFKKGDTGTDTLKFDRPQSTITPLATASAAAGKPTTAADLEKGNEVTTKYNTFDGVPLSGLAETTSKSSSKSTISQKNTPVSQKLAREALDLIMADMGLTDASTLGTPRYSNDGTHIVVELADGRVRRLPIAPNTPTN